MPSLRSLYLVVLLLVGSLVSASAANEERQPPRGSGAQHITRQQLKDYLEFIASDELEGRDTPSRGLDIAAKFLATLCSRWGLKPGGDSGSFFQKIMLRRDAVNVPGSRLELLGKVREYGKEYFALPRTGSVAGEFVYGGDGWFVKDKGLDPYANLDIKGKVVVLDGAATFAPYGIPRNQLQGEEGKDWASPVNHAASRGALGVLLLTTPGRMRAWDSMRRAMESTRMAPEKAQAAAAPGVPVIYLADTASAALFEGEDVSAQQIFEAMEQRRRLPSFALKAGKNGSLAVSVTTERSPTQNVIAIYEGSDPRLKQEYVALGAHYDHVGVATNPQGPDRIFNGADDDGSGTVALLAMAEALAHAHDKPKRSILFVWHAGEEKGLWGSEHFIQKPTVPLKQIVAQFNIDMIGRSKTPGDTTPRNQELSATDEIYVIGARMLSTELGDISDEVNRKFLNLKFNLAYDDPKHPARYFYRSDHIHYARAGIPIIFYFNGTHEDYHRVSDEVSKIDFAKIERVGRTIYLTALEVANRSHRPRVDKKLAD